MDANAPNLSDFAQLVLKEICSQEWVLEHCLQNPEELCQEDLLLDSMLTPKQVHICSIVNFYFKDFKCVFQYRNHSDA